MRVKGDSRGEPGSDGGRGPIAFEAAWRARFEEFAAASDDDAGIAGWSPSGLEARTRRFAALLNGQILGERWLDAGCGAGTYMRLLQDRGATVVGVDYSLPTLQKTRARGTDHGALVVSDVRRLPFSPGSFDGVLCFGVAQALSESAPALRELASMPAPGGQVWVDALNQWCLVHLWDQARRRISGRRKHLRYDSPAAILHAMAASGLVDLEVHWMPILPVKWQRFQGAVESRGAQWVFRHVPLVGALFCHAFIVRGEVRGRVGA